MSVGLPPKTTQKVQQCISTNETEFSRAHAYSKPSLPKLCYSLFPTFYNTQKANHNLELLLTNKQTNKVMKTVPHGKWQRYLTYIHVSSCRLQFNTTLCTKKSHLWLAITLTHMNGF